MNRATAHANANIALVKYWGKSNATFNIPAVSSLSMTLDGIGTTVTISKAPHKNHELFIEKVPISGSALARLHNFLETIRKLYFFNGFFSVRTSATVPYAAGLASSASFYAALSKALNHSLKLTLNDNDLSLMARIGSASAARSIFGGFVGLKGGAISHEDAHAFSISSPLELAMLVAVVEETHKPISSREAMKITSETSPFYKAFCESAPQDFQAAQNALASGSFATLGAIMEHSTLKMHASMWAAKPSINYLLPSTLYVMKVVQQFRNTHGAKAFFTMDAGPNIKILCEKINAQAILDMLLSTGLTTDIRLSYAGSGAKMLNEHLS